MSEFPSYDQKTLRWNNRMPSETARFTKDRFERFFRTLLCGKTRPFVIPAIQRMSCVL
jgi:hypothetical protein